MASTSTTDRLLPDDKLAISDGDQPVPHVCLEGTLDTINTPQFSAYMHGKAPNHRGWVLIDAGKLNMLTSCGAGALIELATAASHSKGGLVMIVPPGNVRDVIGFMRLDLVIDTFETFDDAIAFINTQTPAEAS